VRTRPGDGARRFAPARCARDGRRALAAAALTAGAAACTMPRVVQSIPDPPIPDGVHVEVSGDVVTIEMRGLENVNGDPMIVCLDDVLITAADGGAAWCGFDEHGGCVVIRGGYEVGRVPFRGRARCDVMPQGQVQVVADLKFRESAGDDPWRSITVLAWAELALR
jgi:hypothetical protein